MPLKPRRVLLPENPAEQGEHGADQEAGREWEVEAEVAARVLDVPRQAAEPAAPYTGPQQQSNTAENQAEDEDDFADFVHDGTLEACGVFSNPFAVLSGKGESSRRNVGTGEDADIVIGFPFPYGERRGSS